MKREAADFEKLVWVYVDQNHPVGHPDNIRLFASPEAAERWFKEHDPEGVVFGYELLK